MYGVKSVVAKIFHSLGRRYRKDIVREHNEWSVCILEFALASDINILVQDLQEGREGVK